MLKYAITIGLALMFSIQIAYGQVMGPVPGTGNGFDNSPQQQSDLDDVDPNNTGTLFRLFVENAIPDNDYRLCGGTTGGIPSNFGCERSFKGSELLNEGYEWVLTKPDGVRNTMLYGCVIGDTEKKVSCNITAMPQKGQKTELFIDWSQPSLMDLPPIFRTYDSTYQQLLTEMNQNQQSSNNNNDEDDNNNNSEEDD